MNSKLNPDLNRVFLMPIPVACGCGKKLRIKDELAGRKIRCPECKAVVPVRAPERSAEDEALDVLLSESPDDERPAPPAEPEPAPEPVSARDSEGYGVQAPPATPPVPKPKLPPSVKKVKKESSRGAPLVTFEEGWFGSVNSGVLGGLLMMVIAAVWFFLGLAANRIFFYPPVLFVIGFISILKGLGGEE